MLLEVETTVIIPKINTNKNNKISYLLQETLEISKLHSFIKNLNSQTLFATSQLKTHCSPVNSLINSAALSRLYRFSA